MTLIVTSGTKKFTANWSTFSEWQDVISFYSNHILNGTTPILPNLVMLSTVPKQINSR